MCWGFFPFFSFFPFFFKIRKQAKIYDTTGTNKNVPATMHEIDVLNPTSSSV